MLKVSIWNLKGGQGKSTTAVSLGAVLANQKFKTLLIDLDGQRTLSFALGLDGNQPTAVDWLRTANPETIAKTNTPGLSLIPGDLAMFRLTAVNGLMGKAFNSIRGLDVCLMDCAPSLGPVVVESLLSCDRILIPVLCEPASLKGISEAVQLIRAESPNTPIDVLRVRYRSRLVITQEADELLIGSADELGYRLLYTVIPENIAVAEAIASQKPITEYASKSTGSIAYKALGRECKNLWRLDNGK